VIWEIEPAKGNRRRDSYIMQRRKEREVRSA
jgi:hypothetical protein